MDLMTFFLLGHAIALGNVGFPSIIYYAAQVFHRTLEGGSIDHTLQAVPTFFHLCDHLFVSETILNPNPFTKLHGIRLFAQF